MDISSCGLMNAFIESHHATDENGAPGSRKRSRSPDPNTTAVPDVPIQRSQRLIARHNRMLPIDDARDLTVTTQQIAVPSPTTKTDEEIIVINDYSSNDDDAFRKKSMTYDLLYEDVSASQAREAAVCLMQLAKATDAAEEPLDRIDVDGVTLETFRSTVAQTRQINIYKMEHKITTKETEPDADLYIELGPLGTLVPFNEFKKIAWNDARQAAHDLLSLVFPLHILETHLLSQRFTPFELSDQDNSRPRLDDNKVYDVRYYVTEKTKMSNDAFAFIAAKRLADLAKAKAKQNDYWRSII